MRCKGGNDKFLFISRKNFNATRQKLNEFLSQCAHGFVIAHPQRRIVKAPTHYHAIIVLSQAMDNIITRSRKNNMRFLIFDTLRASLGAPFFSIFLLSFLPRKESRRDHCVDPIFDKVPAGILNNPILLSQDYTIKFSEIPAKKLIFSLIVSIYCTH